MPNKPKRTHCTATIESDDQGELIMILPDHLVQELGWNPGDELIWKIDENDRVTLSKH